MICNELVKLVVDNDFLEEKLNFLEKEKKKSEKVSKRFLSNPFTAKKFEKKKSKYKVSSKMDFNYISERQIKKVENNERRKKERELNDCTFKPQINLKSLRIIENKFGSGKLKKTLRKGKVFSKKKVELSSFKVKNLTGKCKYDKNFYEKQIEWAKKKKDKLKGERKEKKKLEENIYQKNFKKSKITDKNKFDEVKNFSDFHFFEGLNLKKKVNKKKIKRKRI